MDEAEPRDVSEIASAIFSEIVLSFRSERKRNHAGLVSSTARCTVVIASHSSCTTKQGMRSLSGLVCSLHTFIVAVWAQSSFIIRDYFVHKNVTRVVGFSCGDVEDDLLTMKLLNAVGVSAAIKPAGFQLDVLRYLESDYTLGVFLDIRCPGQNISGIYDKGLEHRLFDHSYNWLILGTNLSYSVQSLNDSGFSIITDFVILVPDGESDYVLYDVYNHFKLRGGLLNITRLGTWNEKDGLSIILTESKIIRRRNFHGIRIKAAGIVLHRPETVSLLEYLERDKLEIMDNWPKFGYTLVSYISEIFNFSIDLIEIDHWQKNDTVGPLMEAFKRGEADLGYYPSILTIERYGYARVIVQQWPTRTCFMFRTIPAMKMKPWVILKPFAVDTWCTILALVVIIVFVLSFILKLERAGDYSYSISVLVAIAALCQQGFPSLSEQSASRVALIQITVFGLLVYNYYSAAIVSARLNEPLQKMNDSLYSLVHNKMTLGAEQNVFFNFLLRNTRPDVQYFKNYWNSLPNSKKFIPIEEGVQKMMKGGFAYHADPDDIYPSIDVEFDKQMICQLTEVHLLQPSELGIWSNLHSHLHEISKLALIRMSTSGIQRREVRRRQARKPYCPSEEIFVSSVTIYEVAPMLILLLIGMTLALIVFGIENLMFRLMHSKQTGILPLKRSKLLPKSKAPSVMALKRDKPPMKSKAPSKKNVTMALPKKNTLPKNVLTMKR
ncbi:hypothetical protein EAI_02237 [Harpegnathos saltator]|uniref:Ionotropic receptor 75a N-terminal domain-containing protein n=2 Tax=Harpegnathos saltator TaxID=610380 RepID=E2BLT4_HARSA|nr:hypothetical protein EAI_02237 [Harpegnathos saltator]